MTNVTLIQKSSKGVREKLAGSWMEKGDWADCASAEDVQANFRLGRSVLMRLDLCAPKNSWQALRNFYYNDVCSITSKAIHRNCGQLEAWSTFINKITGGLSGK